MLWPRLLILACDSLCSPSGCRYPAEGEVELIKRLTLSMTVIPMAVIAMLLATSTVAFASGVVRAEAELAPINNSGISGEITFVDNPAAKTLTIQGEAEGLNPARIYFSLLYNVGSPSVGKMACEPTAFPPDPRAISEIQMLVGFWSVNSEGEGKLLTVKSMSGNSNLKANAALLPPFLKGAQNAPGYVGLNKVGNMSIRDVSAGLVLKACGDILPDD
jgi:hypothetical protein